MASYAPYHHFGSSWGIYFFADTFYGLASLITSEDPTLGSSAARLVDDLLFVVSEHELLHFGVEFVATHYEMAMGKPLYSNYFTRHHCRAIGADCLEEAVATAVELRECRRLNRRLAFALEHSLSGLPKGYRDHGKFRRRGQMAAGRASLVARILDRPTVASGELLSRSATTPYFASVPTKITHLDRVPQWFRRLLVDRARVGPVTHDMVIRHAYASGAQVTGGGRHPIKIRRPGKRAVPLQRASGPHVVASHIVAQLAALFDMHPYDYRLVVQRS